MFCKSCPKKMNYQGNITNMMVHLQYYHHSEYLKEKEKGKVKRMQPSWMTSLTTSNRQLSIAEAFHQMEPMSKASVCLCITKDMLYISIIKCYIHLSPDMYHQTEKQLRNIINLPKLYIFERTRIANAIKCGLKYFSFTADG